MSISYPSSICPFLVSGPRHHAFPKTSFFKHKQSFCRMMAYCRLQASLPNPLRRFFLPNGILLPNSAHKSVPFLYQFLVLTQGSSEALGPKWLTGNHYRPSDLVWSGEDTLCGGRGEPLPWWRSSLVEAASRCPRELGKCLSD
jgi:hypothetical protein